MKKLIIVLALFIVSIQSASAFQVEANVQFNQQNASAQACNYGYNGPIFCRVTAFGMSQTGQWVNSWVNATLAPGMCETAYVYANYPYYFVDARGNAECQFAY